MRTFSPALLRAKNALLSTEPFDWLEQLDILTVPLTWYLTTCPTGITFHGQVYQPWPMQIGAIQESPQLEIRQISVSVANIDQQAGDLLEAYWADEPEPDWRARLYQID